MRSNNNDQLDQHQASMQARIIREANDQGADEGRKASSYTQVSKTKNTESSVFNDVAYFQ